MLAISLWQPYASLIAAGVKRFETRHWSPPMRAIGQRVAIHAARRMVLPHEIDPEAAAAIRTALPNWTIDLPRGAVVCTGILRNVYCSEGWLPFQDSVYVRRMPSEPTAFKLDLRPGEQYFGDYSLTRYLWEFDQIEVLPVPHPFRGQQGLFVWDHPIEKAEPTNAT